MATPTPDAPRHTGLLLAGLLAIPFASVTIAAQLGDIASTTDPRDALAGGLRVVLGHAPFLHAARKRLRVVRAGAIELVGMSDRASHRPKQLSGGQEQRIAIARAIVTDPKVILADEPTGDLDRTSADQVLELLERLNEELKKTILMVTHDPHAAQHAQSIVHLDKGQLGGIEDIVAGKGAS